jgi:ubiquinone/menaquinone biosynthesis C-methylase UbiE
MSYVLEDKKEFERLEQQSQIDAYNYQDELRDFKPSPRGKILDAGCGSGIVSRYLSKRFPNAKIFGCDASTDRIEKAKQAASKVTSLEISQQDLTHLTYRTNEFDGIVCRFVLEHLPPTVRDQALHELMRCLKPKGTLCLVDIDGLVYNIYPQSPLVAEVLNTLHKVLPVDLNIGRKLPSLVTTLGLTHVSWRVEAMQFHGEDLELEIENIKQRFAQATPLLTSVIGSERKTLQFQSEYIHSLEKPGAVLFYNKFIVIGKKPVKHLQGLK